ncbi:tRNA (adenine22-N1)-methyltransferase [Halolactibacillus halophilus]|uniref:SAM-dependent methyltransferase n=1 Tax=Halolactibacillus halophilus TaxID=306540 RepID=A0A1I5KUE5_9BACI|nr:tRNA (adenine(22)-N(1))-methyltransferase TrmK [Halolactibacillus halophilus]GEM00496.1 SAM-dependent methyltransferase [Halolactibacillus halophilus]SFO88246.1 tRNA (adenine22-N1)-methyltransferase [Halolactibacillus halophilus]
MEIIKLSNRLKQASQYIDTGAFFADIGSDHAYLPIYVCQQDPSAKGIAGELNQGPFEAAISHVRGNQLSDRIDVRKGDGLTVIGKAPVDTVVICGMGGGLIRAILAEGKAYLTHVKRLVLQPNMDSHYLREWLVKNDFNLVREEILKEDGHIYEILIADKVLKSAALTPKDLLFGPFLRRESSAVFKEKWEREYDNVVRVIDNMALAKQINEEKLALYQQRKQWIREVLTNA